MSAPVTLFSLPLELRLLIWGLCPPPPDEPEVLIIRKEHADADGTLLPLKSMMVNTAFPALMHVCHESRAFVLKHTTTHFRFCPEAGCDVPCRPFDFHLDTLYLGQDLQGLTLAIGWVAEVRHLAIPSWATSHIAGSPTGDFLLRKCRELRTLSVVFRGEFDGDMLEPEFRVPKRHCQLRRFRPDSTARVTMLVADQVRQVKLDEFMTTFRAAVLKQGEAFDYVYAHWAGWLDNAMRVSLTDLAFDACFPQMLLEWRNGDWVGTSAEEKVPEGKD